MFKIKLEGGRTMEVEEKTYWHTTSHILAQAIKRLYPEMKLAIGPAIDNGFYYDFDTEKPFTPEMLSALEEEMKKIIKEDYVIERFELPRAEALKLMEEKERTGDSEGRTPVYEKKGGRFEDEQPERTQQTQGGGESIPEDCKPAQQEQEEISETVG